MTQKPGTRPRNPKSTAPSFLGKAASGDKEAIPTSEPGLAQPEAQPDNSQSPPSYNSGMKCVEEGLEQRTVARGPSIEELDAEHDLEALKWAALMVLAGVESEDGSTMSRVPKQSLRILREALQDYCPDL